MVSPREFLADQIVASIARPQKGVVARHQLLAAGLTEREIDYRVENGKLTRACSGVFLIAGVPASFESDVVAACLWAGGHASHRTAAHLLSLPGGRRYPIEVSTNRPLTSERLIVHRRAPLPDCDLTVVNGLPTTAPHRTLLDLAAGVPEVVVEMALDEALKKELVTYPQLRWHLASTGRRGIRGTAKLRRILNARTGEKGRRDSPLETLGGRLFRNSPLPWPVLQYQVWDRAEHLGRIDFAYPQWTLGIELLGWDPHSGKVNWERDLRRRTYLQSRGWLILEFTWNDITKQRDYVIETIQRAISIRSFLPHPHVL
jgi:hypothetical protein